MENKIHSKLDKWIRYSNDIRVDAQNLMIKTKLYDDYIEIVKANKSIQNPDDFHQWIMRNYFESALMSIRRLTDDHRGCISLINLLEDMKCYHHLITKNFYLRDLKNGDGLIPTTKDYASDWFDENYSTNDKDLDQNIVESDIGELKKQTQLVEKFIDNTLAHKNKGSRGKQAIKTEKIRQAIKKIEEVTCKYLDLLGHGSYQELTPVWQYDHKSIFRKTWILDNSL
ncbi:MAG: hypothetical protein H6772_05005 [Pseudomonadales bacterium]|nr:hypothetical protein [Pseudomonadales bacterium]